MKHRKPTVRIVTAVWGEWHIDAFLYLSLPTLLSPGNLPAFAKTYDIVFEFFTRTEDLERLREAPAVRALSAIGRCEYEVLDERLLVEPISAHSEAWNRTVVRAKGLDHWVLFLAPDTAWGDGSFASLAREIEAGKTAIFMQYMRVVCPTFVSDFWDRFGFESQVVTIGCRDLVRMGCNHLHPLFASYFWNSNFFPYHSEMVIWPISGEGVMVRVLAREMFLFHPGKVEMSDQLLLSKSFDASSVKMMDDSDSFFAVSLADMGKDFSWHDRPAKANPVEIGVWMLRNDSPANELLAQTPVFWKFADATPSRWDRRAKASEKFLQKAKITHDAIRVWRGLLHLVNSGHSVYAVASILAFTLYSGLLSRLEHQRPAILIVPTDDVVRAHELAIAGAISDASGDLLTDLLLSHLFECSENIEPMIEGLALGESQEIHDGHNRARTLKREISGELTIDGHLITPADGFSVGTGDILYIASAIFHDAT